MKLKKIMATLMASSILMTSTALFASAEGTTIEAAGDTDITVKAMTDGAVPGKTYKIDDPYAKMSVKVDWDDPEFTYNFGTHWNPDTFEYEAYAGEAKVGWDHKVNITVTSRSNCEVEADVTFEKTARGLVDVSAEFSKSTEIIPAAVDGVEHSALFTLKAVGNPEETLEHIALGTITVAIHGVR